MAFAVKKPEPQSQAPQGVQIHVGRDAVNNASRQTSITINKMTDQIARQIAVEVEKKQR